MAYIGQSVIGVEHPSTSALNATTGTFSGLVKLDSIQTNAGKPILNSTGSVLQVVRTYVASSSVIETTAQTFQASGITASITPTKSGNIILVDGT